MSETSADNPIVSNSAQVKTQPTKDIDSDEQQSESGVYSYIFVGVLSVVLLLLLYYAYNRFVTNAVKEPFTKGNKQERDDPVVDFNLRETIEELRRLQGQVLKTLSESN